MIMKKMLCLLFILPSLAFAQNSYTVSNAPGSVANFKTLQGAHDSVAAGSILYVLPSSATYGNVVFTKKLTVYGSGFFLGANLAPNTQANTGAVILNSIKFLPGSDNSYIEGLQLTDRVATGVTPRILLDTVSNVIVSRCLFTAPNAINGAFFTFNTVSNSIIKQCYFNANGDMNAFIIEYGVTTGFTGVQFNNNIIDYTYFTSNGFFMLYGNGPGVTMDATFTNNTFLVNLWNSDYGNFNYTSNIFVNTGGTGNFNNNGHSLNGTNLNNIVQAPLFFPSVGNNLQGANTTDSIFVGSQPGFHSIDQKWMLRPGDPANTFGQGGTAVGMFGGNNPYVLSGIPAIPYIYSLNVPAQATAPGTIGVHIKARPTNN
jgi:hypothetical protein